MRRTLASALAASLVALGAAGQAGAQDMTTGRTAPLVDIGISSYTGAGKVYDLRTPADLNGTFAASQATFAIGGGDSAMTMKNDRGVTLVFLKNQGQESGTQLSVGPTGMKITLK